MPDAIATPSAPPPAPTVTPSDTPPVPTSPSSDSPTPEPIKTPTAPNKARQAAYDELEALDKEPTPARQPPKKPAQSTTTQTGAKPAEKKPSSDTTGEKSGSADTASTDASSHEGEDKPVPAAKLRPAYEAAKAEVKRLTVELEKAKTAKPAEDPEKATLVESLSAKDKRIKELEDSLRYADYQQTDEYKTKYEKPFVQAYAAGRAKATALKVRVGRKLDAEGNVIEPGTTRQGTAEDFDAIARAGSDDDAAALAEELFGRNAPVVLYHRERVQELGSQAQQAVDDFRKQGSERFKAETEARTKQQAEVQKRQTEAASTFKRLNQEAIERYPHYFKAADDDAKGSELLKKGFALADAGFSGNGDLPPEEMIKVHSALHNKAAAFDYIAYRLKTANSRIKELETQLSELNESTPKGGSPKREGGEVKTKAGRREAAFAELDELDKANK